MYVLYSSPNSAAMAPQVVLHEIGADFRIEPVDLSGEKRDPAYLKLNPTGRVPTLIAADGKTVFYESAAIVLYLADRHPDVKLAPAPGELQRAPFLQWLFHLTNTLQPAYLRWYYAPRFTADPAGIDAVKAAAAAELQAIWGQLDRALDPGPYLLGERFSAADLYLHMLSTWRDPVPDLDRTCRRVIDCAQLVGERPAVQRMMRDHPPS